MKNEDLLHDLKQFIEATVSQQTARLEKRMDTIEGHVGAINGRIDLVNGRIDLIDGRIEKIEGRIGAIETGMATKKDLQDLEEHIDEKLNTIQDAIGETFDNSDKMADARFDDHEQRLRILEQSAA